MFEPGVKYVLPQTKSKAKKVFRETTLYFGQPIGAALNGLFNRFVQESCGAGTEKRKREILVISDGMSCKVFAVWGVPPADIFSADDLGSALVGISKKLDELGWSEPQVDNIRPRLRYSKLSG